MSKEKPLKKGEHRCSLCGRISAAKSVLRKTKDEKTKAIIWVCTNKNKCAEKAVGSKKVATKKPAEVKKVEKKEEVVDGLVVVNLGDVEAKKPEPVKETKPEEEKPKEKEVEKPKEKEAPQEEAKPEEEKVEEKKPEGDTALAEKIRKIREQAKAKQS